MTEKKGKPLNYERLWKTTKGHVAGLRDINPDLKYANIDVEKIENECGGDPKKCLNEYWKQLRDILNEDEQ